MWKHSGAMKAFTENIFARLKAEIETERWQILLTQKQVIEEYSRIVARLNDLDGQIMRLCGSPPPSNICPQCHIRCDSSVALVPTREGEGDATFMECPDCGLVVPPAG